MSDEFTVEMARTIVIEWCYMQGYFPDKESIRVEDIIEDAPHDFRTVSFTTTDGVRVKGKASSDGEFYLISVV